MTAVPGLVGLSDIARMLGVTRQRAHQLAASEGFPAPVETIGDRIRTWSREAVEDWARETGREIRGDK